MAKRRIQMRPDAAPEPIVTVDERHLGTFIPGHGYWITDENMPTVEKVLADGRAYEVEPVPVPGLSVLAGDGIAEGSIEIGD